MTPRAPDTVRTGARFSTATDPDVFFPGESHRQALETLVLAVERGERLVMLTGEPGTGKTTVLQRLMEALASSGSRVIIHRLPVGPVELQASIAAAPPENPVAVALDEAQALTDAVLEDLPSLLVQHPALRIVLAGQPGLTERLAALGTRVPVPLSARALLGPLGPAEVGPYIDHRWRRTASGPHPFRAAAVRRIATASGGIPQVVNVICDRAVHLATTRGRTTVSRPLVDRVVRDVTLTERWSARSALAHWVSAGGAWRGAAVAAIVAIPLMITAAIILRSPARQGDGDRASETARPTAVVTAERPPAAGTVTAPPAVAPPTPATVPPVAPPSAPSAPVVASPPAVTGATPAARPPDVTRPRPVAPARAVAKSPADSKRSSEKTRDRPRGTAVASGTGRQPSAGVGPAPAATRPLPPPAVPAVVATGRDASRDRVLLERVEDGDVGAARRLLAEGASPDARDPAGLTPLMLAAIRGDSAMIELLTARGASVNAQNRLGLTPLMLAAINNRLPALRALVARGASVNTRTTAGWTALTYAAWRGHPDAVRFLLARGADPRVTDRGHWTVLEYASWRAAQPAESEDLPGFETARAAGASDHAEVVALLKRSGDQHVRPIARRPTRPR